MSLSPAQILGVGPNPGQNHFNIGIGREGGHTDYGQNLLANGYASTPEFVVNPAGDATVFRVLCGAKTTSKNTKYPRVELREETPNGDLAAWDGRTGTHRMGGVSRVLYLPPVKPWVCFAQIHNDKSDLARIQVEGDKVVVRNTPPGSDEELKTTVRTGYTWGDLLDWDLVVVDGLGSVLIDGVEVATFPAGQDGLYFKAGAYLQTNLSIEKDPAQYGLVEILRDTFECWHTGSASPVPPPAQGPGAPPVTSGPSATKVVMIIRHGEKPVSGHDLSPRGRDRAEALPPLFTGPRADLYRPGYVFASKGNTASMRMLQTAQPTATALGIGVDTRYDSENAETETAQLLAAQANTGRPVLAVLEHSAIPGVAADLVDELGGMWDSEPPEDWGDDVFDQVWLFVGDDAGHWTFSVRNEAVLPGDNGYQAPADPPPPVDPPVEQPPATAQTLGVGGVATPPGAILATSDTTAPLTITRPGVYDGQGHKVGRVTVNAGNVTVQNYRVNAGGQYGAVLDADDVTLQNCDITGVEPSGDGDLNAITAFGDRIRIRYNTAVDYVTGDPGDSHTDFIQTWVSSSHPKAGKDWEIVGNKATGPANPKRDSSVPSIHQWLMVEGAGRGGNSGGSGKPSGWLIADNIIGDSWNQAIKLDGVDDFTITRNRFVGSSDKVIEVTEASTGVKFYDDNEIGGGYGSTGTSVTDGAGPGQPPVVTPPPVEDPPVEVPPVTGPPPVDPPVDPVPDPTPTPPAPTPGPAPSLWARIWAALVAWWKQLAK